MYKEKLNQTLVFEDFSATLRRSKRKDVEIQVRADNSVIIFAPVSLKVEQVRSLVNKRLQWIQSKRLTRSLTLQKNRKEYVPGESFLLFGDNYSLDIKNHGKQSNLIHDGKRFQLKPQATKDGEKWFISFYKRAAKEILIPRAEGLAKKLGYKASQIRVMELGARWGSCSSAKRINLNWRLAMLPKHIADYVIIHELTHIEATGHKEKFWKKVELAMPKYRDAERWLLKNGHKVVL
jgi:predicted metal-dependent hydrolase